jgi:hypothetical protein
MLKHALRFVPRGQAEVTGHDVLRGIGLDELVPVMRLYPNPSQSSQNEPLSSFGFLSDPLSHPSNEVRYH